MPQELPNDLRIIILGNYEMLGKYQTWVQVELNVQSSFQRQDCCNTGSASQNAGEPKNVGFCFFWNC